MVRTRFAPSPTGYLHIGGVRTALFCWLFARRHGGQFILRIDDTDQQRNNEAALAPILHGLRWLGIDWDEGPDVGGPYGPYFQLQRLGRYQAAVDKLLAGGFAYRDYATVDELKAERETAEREKRAFLYSRHWMAETEADNERFQGEGRQAVVRLKMPREGTLVIKDHVRGDVSFDWAREQDHVIQRADGTCLYHLASVVDDFDFQITHVIRAEEHLSNTPRQIFIAQSLGYPLPEYAHLPFVAEPGSKNKLSKRKLDKYLKNRDFAQVHEHGQKIAQEMGIAMSAETFNPVIVDFYEQVGYLPEAIVNYLALLGWSLDDKTEFLSRDELCRNFSLDRVTKASASLDTKKLWSFQDHYMRELSVEKKADLMAPYLDRAGLVSSPISDKDRRTLERIIVASGDRLKVVGDILAYGDFFFRDQIEYDEQAVEKRLKSPDGRSLLLRLQDLMEDETDYSADALEKAIRKFIERENVKPGDVVHTLRLATTGKTAGPGLYDCLSIMGKAKCLNRISLVLLK